MGLGLSLLSLCSPTGSLAGTWTVSSRRGENGGIPGKSPPRTTSQTETLRSRHQPKPVEPRWLLMCTTQAWVSFLEILTPCCYKVRG